MEVAKNLLKVKGLHKCFWAEAIHTVAYILNQSLTTTLHNKTPIKGWHGWTKGITSQSL